jgi:hypothetical protein
VVADVSDAYLAVFSALALLGGYVVVGLLIQLLRATAFWLAFQFAGSEHPDCLDRLADAMELK